MEFLQGLSSKQIRLVQSCSEYVRHGKSEVIFNEGDPAVELFIVLAGEVEIFRTDSEGQDHRLSLIGPNQVFGEMGLISDVERRTASARALESTTLFVIEGNPIRAMKRIGDHKAALRLYRNLGNLLSHRLSSKDLPSAQVVENAVSTYGGDTVYTKGALRAIEASLPSGPLVSLLENRSLRSGQTLFQELEESDGFYFLHSGELEIFKGRPDKEVSLGSVHAPAVVGESGYISDRPRTATIRAKGIARLSHFSRRDFQALEEREPETAARVLFSLMELLIARIVDRESENA